MITSLDFNRTTSHLMSSSTTHRSSIENIINNLIINELRSHCPSLVAQHELIASYTTLDPIESMTLQSIAFPSLIYASITYLRATEIFQVIINSIRRIKSEYPSRLTSGAPSKDEVTRLVEDPFQFYETINEYRHSYHPHCSRRPRPSFDESFLSLGLCLCPKMSSPLRRFTSAVSLHHLTAMRSHTKESLLTLLTVGMGGGYHEIAYVIAPFARAGFNKMNVVCIDNAETTSIVINSMTRFCRNKLPHCDITFFSFIKIEDYVSVAQHHKSLHPNLLLLLDLADSECNMGDQTLFDYSFTLLQKEELLSPGTVIVYSTFKLDTTEATRTAICCTYQSKSANLKDVVPRNELAEILEGSPDQHARSWKVRETRQSKK